MEAGGINIDSHPVAPQQAELEWEQLGQWHEQNLVIWMGGGDFMPASDGSIRSNRVSGSGIRRVVFQLVDGNGRDTRSVVLPSGIAGRVDGVLP